MAGSETPVAEEMLETGELHTPVGSPPKSILSNGRRSTELSGKSGSSSRSLHWGKDESKDAPEADDDEDLGDHPKHPPNMSVLSSVMSNVQSVIHDIEDRLHRMPKWQFRLLVGSVFFLLFALILMTVITVVYGFGMSFPHISVKSIQPHLPFPFMDARGAIPITSTMSFSNPNAFKAHTHPTFIDIYALPSRSPASLLAKAEAPGMAFRAHQEHLMVADFTIEAINKAEGGPALVTAVAGGKSTLMYTTSLTKITVKSLGFLPISRNYRAECTILQEWGPGGKVLSDCWGRFV